ncbi:MAG: aminotransferase class V-fold PLP-dependent enzyme, partial [Bacteroidota bacterium]
MSLSTTGSPEETNFTQLRLREYPQLDAQRHTYLDFTGAGLYASSQVLEHQEWLLTNILGNPHSINPSSKRADEAVATTRQQILDFFNAQDDYYCIFTANASAAVRIVAESYSFDDSSQLTLLADNHNSVNGLREYCRRAGGQFNYVPLTTPCLRIDEQVLAATLSNKSSSANRLFAYPAQSNFSGVQHDLSWVHVAQSQGWDVLLDVAAYVPTNRLDLQVITADFVPISFYKMFGYPTGLGCLLVRKAAFTKLRKTSFTGGTVQFVSNNADVYHLHDHHERFEDGTINFLDIPAIGRGLNLLSKIGMCQINSRVKITCSYALDKLRSLQHSNGQPLLKFLGPTDLDGRGGTITFNIYQAIGKHIPIDIIETKAAEANISLRTGCFCNPGC